MNKMFMLDFDGTIVESMYYWWKLSEEYLINTNIVPLKNTPELTWKYDFNGLYQYFEDTYKIDVSYDLFCNRLNQIIKKHYINDIGLKPGCEEFLHFLKTKNIKVLVVTNTCRDSLQPCLDKYDLNRYIYGVESSFDTNMPKNDPNTFKKILDKYSVNSTDCILVDDSISAIKAAKKVGITTIGIFEYYTSSHWKEIEKEADYQVSDLSTLIKFIQNNQLLSRF